MPPHAAGSGHLCQVETNVAVTAVASAATQTITNMSLVGDWVTFVSDTDCYIRFDRSASGVNAVGSATSADWPMKAGIEYNWFCTPEGAYFSVIRKTADGILSRYRSNA
jgi:hypothetical protein